MDLSKIEPAHKQSNAQPPMIIGFVGLTHLGLVHSIGAASKGFTVIGIDPRESHIDCLTQGELTITEPRLHELYEKSKANITFTSDFSLIQKCDVVYFSHDVPTDVSDRSEITSVRNLINHTLAFVPKTSCLVILCQVPPGFSRVIKDSHEIEIYYQVETLIFGQAVERFLGPERIILGASNAEIEYSDKLHNYLQSFGCPIIRMSFESAELAKISINIFLATSITTANILSDLAQLVGAKWNELVPSLHLDRRLGPHSYINPGLGLAGGNIERDIVTALELSKEQEGLASDFYELIRKINDDRKIWPSRILKKELLPNKAPVHIAVWGIAYKSTTNSIRNAPALANFGRLKEDFIIHAFDPEVTILPKTFDFVNLEQSPFDCLEKAEALVIFNDSKEFIQVEESQVKRLMRGKLIIDPFGFWSSKDLGGFDYYSLVAESRRESKMIR
jgi:UDPglucose 6-dehydrogenase